MKSRMIIVSLITSLPAVLLPAGFQARTKPDAEITFINAIERVKSVLKDGKVYVGNH